MTNAIVFMVAVSCCGTGFVNCGIIRIPVVVTFVFY